MAERIDFMKPWRMSDVVLRTMNSNGVGLHASKSFLSMYSTYFQAMFFGGFKEKVAEQVELQEDFTVVHSALQILHHQDRLEPGGPCKQYSPSELQKLYVFADKCDVPLIRELSKAQLVQKKVKEALEVADQLGLDDVKSKLVESLDKFVLQEYLKVNDQDRAFSNADVSVLINKFSQARRVFGSVSAPARRSVRQQGTDFTKAWPMSDVVIHILNSEGVGLHASKSLLAVYSPYFHAMFFGDFKEKDAEQVKLQEDFTVVHSALRILHHEDRLDPGGTSMDYSPSELFELYQFADKCDAPLIRELCKAQLAKKTVKEALEVAIQLGLDDVKSKQVESLSMSVLLQYLKDHGQDRFFSNAEVNALFEKCGYY